MPSTSAPSFTDVVTVVDDVGTWCSTGTVDVGGTVDDGHLVPYIST
jgi:hypothetical protein